MDRLPPLKGPIRKGLEQGQSYPVGVPEGGFLVTKYHPVETLFLQVEEEPLEPEGECESVHTV